MHLQCTYSAARRVHFSQQKGAVIQAVIGKSLITSLKPGVKPYEVRDTRLKGLLLRVQPSGVMSWYVEYGRGKRLCIGRADAIAPPIARDEAKAVLVEVYAGKDPLAARRRAKARTFRAFIREVYAPWAQENIRTSDATVKRLIASFPELQEKRLVEITPWLIEKWRMRRLKTGAQPSTVNRDLDDLKSSLGKAITWGLLETHPVQAIKRLRTDPMPIVRYLTSSEEARLRTALDARDARIRSQRMSANAWRRSRNYALLPELSDVTFADHLKPMVLLSLNTGLRRGELFKLSWAEVDLVGKRLTVIAASAKSGRSRHIPLNSEALATMLTWREGAFHDDRLVFPNHDGLPFNNVRSAWMAVLKAAQIEQFRWHDLRHAFASRLVMAGVDLNTVRELLGHASYQMTLRYAHLAPEHKVDAVARISGTQV